MSRALRASFAVCLALGAVSACGWDPSRPFERESPVVNRALVELDAGDAGTAAELLEGYLSTGACEESQIGTPGTLRARPNGALDLGIALFRIGEAFGARFGDEERAKKGGGGGQAPAPLSQDGLRASHIECALRIVRSLADDPSQPVELRARARYLEGNLLFLDAKYKEAVAAYDKSLLLSPGFPEGGVDAQGGPRVGDPVGLDAAWNRAIALRRIEDKNDAGPDSGQDGGQDSGQDGGQDSGKDGGQDSGKDGGQDSGQDGGGDRDAGRDGGGKDAGEDGATPPPPRPEDSGAPPPRESSQDERLLDQLENAPTVQREAARRQRRAVKVRGSEDK